MRYKTILADPPWKSISGRSGRAEAHYPLMTDADIASLPVSQLASPDAVLLLWATWHNLPGALATIAAWDFDYLTGFPWIKVLASDPSRPAYGTGFWARCCSEPLLLATRGRPTQARAAINHADWLGLLGPGLEHSRKPASIYQYAETLPGPYLELFARPPTRPGWHVWGNEVEDDIDLHPSRSSRLCGEPQEKPE